MEFYYQTPKTRSSITRHVGYNQRLGYLLMVQKSSAICQVWFPLIPLPTHKSESPGLRHRNRSQVNTWIHGINLPPPDRRKARTATMLQAGSGRQSFPPDSEQHHTGNSGISLISFHPSRIPVLLPPKSERRTLCKFRELTSTWSFGPAISTQKQHSTSLHAHTNRSDLELGGKINKRAAYHENNTNLSIQVLPKQKYIPLAGGVGMRWALRILSEPNYPEILHRHDANKQSYVHLQLKRSSVMTLNWHFKVIVTSR